MPPGSAETATILPVRTFAPWSSGNFPSPSVAIIAKLDDGSFVFTAVELDAHLGALLAAHVPTRSFVPSQTNSPRSPTGRCVPQPTQNVAP